MIIRYVSILGSTSRKNISKKIDKKVWDGRFLGTPTRRRDEKPGEAAGAGHPEKPPEGVAIRRFEGNDYRKPPRVFRGRREAPEEQKARRSDLALRGVVW